MTNEKRQQGIRLHHGKWQVRYYDPLGRQRSASFARKSDALAFRDGTRTDIRRGVWVDPDAGRERFEAYAAKWFEGTAHLRAGTREKIAGHLRNHILPEFREARVGDIRPVDTRAWVSRMAASSMAPATVGSVYRTFSKIMKTAAIEDLIVRSPCLGVEIPRDDRHEEMHFLSPEDIDRVADAIDPRYRALIYTAAYTGARWGELAGVRVERVNLLRGSVDIVETLAEINGHLIVQGTKTGAIRKVSMPRFLAEMLGEHIGTYPSESGYVFTSAEGMPLRRRNFYRRHYKPAVLATGLDPALRFHDLRHTHVALLIAQGAHAKEIADRLGHSSPVVTMRTYAHVLPSLEERLRDGLDATFESARAARNVDQGWTNGVSGAVLDMKKGAISAP
jgi:integrase